MSDLYAAIMSWAVTLSGYPMPARPPEIVMVEHRLLVERACDGQECKVMGWFPPGSRIYLDKRLNIAGSVYHSSILLHEMVHYLQQQSGRYGVPPSCESAIEMEREAYSVQREFLLRYGIYHPVGASMHSAGCELAAKHGE